jgi:hypothetical protein
VTSCKNVVLLSVSAFKMYWARTIVGMYRIVPVSQLARVLATAIYFHPGLILAGKARSLPLKGSPIRSSILVSPSLAITKAPQNQPKVPKSTQKHPKAPKSTQKRPKAPKSTQKRPKAPKSAQKHPKAPKSAKKC